MFKELMAGALAVALAVSTGFAQASRPGGALKPGDAAPALSNVEWLKGEPAPQWEKGHVYVLDFWATWCGPCIQSIPHLNELQKKYSDKNVHVIGVAVWPKRGMKPTAGYVQSRGDDMGYRIAEDVNNKTAAAFMEATNSQGIPTAMVIDKEGRLVWIGHPMAGMDSVVERVVGDTYDLDAEVKRVKAEEAERAQAAAIIRQFQDAQAASDWDALIAAADKLLAMDPDRYGQAGLAKYFVTLVEKKDAEKAAMIGRELVAGIFANSPQALEAIAWMIADDGRIAEEHQDLDLALLAAQRGVELSKGANPSILDTLAKVHFERGEVDKAIANQTKAIAMEEDPEQKAALEQTLVTYQAEPASKE